MRALLADLDLLVRETTQFDPATTNRTFRHIGTDYARVALLPFDLPALSAQLEQDETDLAVVTGMNPPEARRRPGLVEAFKVIERKGHRRGDGPLSLDMFRAAEHVLISPEGGGFFGATDKVWPTWAAPTAPRARRPGSSDVIHHSDQGSRYTPFSGRNVHCTLRKPASPFGLRCTEADVRPFMGRVGDAYDNAICKSPFATRECEFLDRRRFRTPAEASMAIFEFIEDWYNLRRRHSALEYLSPIGHKTEPPRDAKAL